MKKYFLAWLCIMLGARVLLSSLALEKGFPPQHLQLEEQVHGYVNSTSVLRHGDVNGREYVFKHGVFNSSKGQKGKGASYGGANIAHRPRPSESRAASLPKIPSICTSMAIFCITIGLRLIFPF